jgi:hypothetical protein
LDKVINVFVLVPDLALMEAASFLAAGAVRVPKRYSGQQEHASKIKQNF